MFQVEDDYLKHYLISHYYLFLWFFREMCGKVEKMNNLEYGR